MKHAYMEGESSSSSPQVRIERSLLPANLPRFPPLPLSLIPSIPFFLLATRHLSLPLITRLSAAAAAEARIMRLLSSKKASDSTPFPPVTRHFSLSLSRATRLSAAAAAKARFMRLLSSKKASESSRNCRRSRPQASTASRFLRWSMSEPTYLQMRDEG